MCILLHAYLAVTKFRYVELLPIRSNFVDAFSFIREPVILSRSESEITYLNIRVQQ
jgi:hypothetical protein